MATVSDLIHSSFRLIGAIAAGELLETNELNDALVSLNQMISSWNTEGVTLYGRTALKVFVPPAVPGDIAGNQITLATRPVKIESASMAVANIDNPLEIVDSAGWESIQEKELASIFTKKLYCDYAYPVSTVYIWPQMRAGGILEMWTYIAITQFVNLTDTINLPPGYEMALRYNFAIAILPEYPRSQVDASLPAQAQMYKASIVQLNASNHLRSQMPSAAQSAMTDAATTAAR